AGEAVDVGDGGRVQAAPFHGEDPTRIGWAGVTFILHHEDAAALVLVDSGAEGDDRLGTFATVFATRRQEMGSMIEHTFERALLPEGIPEEKRSTCMHCPLIEGDDPVFSPSTKCCTYTPDLPSYSVGGVLADTSPETRWARDVLTARIAGRTGITPLGIRRLA